MQFVQVRNELLDIVRDARAADGGENKLVADELDHSFERPLAHCPIAPRLRSIARNLARCLDPADADAMKIYSYDLPTEALIGEVVRPSQPNKLKSVAQVVLLCRSIMEKAKKPKHKDMAELLATALGDATFPKGVVVLSLHMANRDVFAAFREALSKAEGGAQLAERDVFSEALFDEGSKVNANLRRTMMYHLETGYNDGGAAYKAAPVLAEEIYEGCKRLSEKFGVPLPPLIDPNPFERAHSRIALFRYGAQAGPRNGHSSKSLPVSLGNIVD